MDQSGVAAAAAHLPQPEALTTAGQIEEYTSNLLGFLEDLVEKTVPMAKNVVGYSCQWWTAEVQERVQAARAARRQGASAEELRAINQSKKKAIQRAKMAHFRRKVHEAATQAKRYLEASTIGKRTQPPTPRATR